MINILDQYTQVSFETSDDKYKYTGVCNIKDNTINYINVTVYLDKDRLGDMNIRNDSGISISLLDSADLKNLFSFTNILNEIKTELEETLLTK